MTNIYEQLGVRTIINCATTYTRLGGSLMAPNVVEQIASSVDAFVNLPELQAKAGERLAQLTGNEAAYVSNGAAAAISLATAACITGMDPALMARLPNEIDGLKNEVIVHRTQRNWYDFAVRQVGITFVEIGHTAETYDWEVDAAINERTAAVIYFAGPHLNHNTLPLPYVVERAHAHGVPVIVDAAAQIPPVSNLWYYTKECGADVAVFSGGKNLGGPQSSGLTVGRREIIEAMKMHGPPNQGFGRAMKVSKESMVGLVGAVEHYINLDFDAELEKWNQVVDLWTESWEERAGAATRVTKYAENEAGEPIPRVIVEVLTGAPVTRDQLVEILREGEHPIEVVLHDANSVAFSPHLLNTGEAETVTKRVSQVLYGIASGEIRG